MKNWTDDFVKLVDDKTANLSVDDFTARFGWVEKLATAATEILSPEKLSAMSPADIYQALSALSIPQCPLRLAHLGRANSAETIIQALINLGETAGGFAEKYRAAKFPQAGMATITELLCALRPHRFIARNTAFTRALSNVTPFYDYRALVIMEYEEFLDLCRVLCDILANHQHQTIREYAKKYRYLWLYALIIA